MKTRLLGAVLLSFATLPRPACAADQVKDALVGAWRLAALEEPGADGTLHRADCTGLLVFTGDGHMSVQVMYRSAEPPAGAAPVQYAQGGYEASFGRYNVDARARTFTFGVEGALVRSLVGRELPRRFELAGGQLVITSTDPKERWKAVWAKAPERKDAR
jgi:hypothetical protein